jgi:DNA-binding CsgD family transcriptional regulator
MPLRVSPVTVGRDEPIALAERRIAQVAGGVGHVLLLSGEAGIGKTRLLAEIRTCAAGRGFAVQDAAAYPRDGEVAGSLLADLVRGGADPAIARRLAAAGAGGDGHARRRTLAADLAALLGGPAAAGRPTLVVLDDLHWADDLSLEVLDRAARRVAERPMLVVGAYRDNELDPRRPMRAWRAGLLSRRLAEEVRLSRLDAEGTAAMCAAITGALLGEDVVRALHARSDGIPLHVEELLANAVAGQVPDTLADAVLATADGLSPAARALAAAAAVIGRSFDLDLLAAAVGGPAGAVDAALRELTDRHLVVAGADGRAYDFRHALIRDALYADLPPLRRRDLHLTVADAARAAGLGDAFLSNQYERAHRPAEAYRHAMAAGSAAVAMSAHREAVECYRRAQRTMPGATPTEERAALLARLGAELAAVDDNRAAADAYEQAYRLSGNVSLVPDLVAVRHLLGASLAERTALLDDGLARAEDATRVHIEAALSAAYMLARHLDEAITYGEQARGSATGAVRWNVEASLGAALVFAGRMDEGWRVLEDAIAAAIRADNEAEAARAYRMMGSCASVLVEYGRAARWLREGIAYAERTERFNDRNYMIAHLAHVHWATGAPDDARREAQRALADGGGGVTTLITADHMLGYLALGRGDLDTAARHLDSARELGERMAELQRLSPALWGLAEVELRAGRPDAAVALCARGYAASAEVADAAYLFPYVVTGARAHLARGDLTGARRWVADCAQALARRGIPGTRPAVDHAIGLVQMAEGQTGKARTALEAASAGWEARDRAWEATQALLDRARCANRSRRPGDAAVLAAKARERAVAAGFEVLLDAPQAGTGADATAGATGEAPLTPREVEVARLVATGATNRQIAAALSIAPKTVAAHLEHILAKLGAARRTEIAAWVAARRT